MRIADNGQLVSLLKSLGFHNLHHANSVSTWNTFFKNNALLSRRYVKQNNLWQTYQKSDTSDMENDVYDDVFLDIMDLHSVFQRKNDYGPVVGVFSIEMLENPLFYIEITRSNPIYWDDSPEYFNDIAEYAKELTECVNNHDAVQMARMMITIRSPEKHISLASLQSLVLDNPHMSMSYYGDKYDLYEDAYNMLSQNGIPVMSRTCPSTCKCNKGYLEKSERTAFMFLDESSIRHSFHKEFH